jgi:cyanate permease
MGRFVDERKEQSYWLVAIAMLLVTGSQGIFFFGGNALTPRRLVLVVASSALMLTCLVLVFLIHRQRR